MQIVKLSLKKANKIPIEADNINLTTLPAKLQKKLRLFLSGTETGSALSEISSM